jgi:hypothetical protein
VTHQSWVQERAIRLFAQAVCSGDAEEAEIWAEIAFALGEREEVRGAA